MGWRFIDAGIVDGIYGPALFEAVSVERSLGNAPDTVLFWTPSEPTIYLGFHETAAGQVDVAACRAAGVPIVRRTLGGGTGYCDREQIIYNVIFAEDRQGIPRGPAGVYHTVLPGVLNALHRLGLRDCSIEEARYGVYAGGRKISGSGQGMSGGVVDSSGSILMDFDYDAMKRIFLDPVKNLAAGVREPEEGMTTLRRELGRRIERDETAAALREGFTEAIGTLGDGELTKQEAERAEILKEKYLSYEWTFRADIRRARREQIKTMQSKS